MLTCAGVAASLGRLLANEQGAVLTERVVHDVLLLAIGAVPGVVPRGVLAGVREDLAGVRLRGRAGTRRPRSRSPRGTS